MALKINSLCLIVGYILKTGLEFLLKKLNFFYVFLVICDPFRFQNLEVSDRFWLLSNAIILSNILLTKRSAPFRLMFSTFLCWAMSAQNTKSHISSNHKADEKASLSFPEIIQFLTSCHTRPISSQTTNLPHSREHLRTHYTLLKKYLIAMINFFCPNEINECKCKRL